MRALPAVASELATAVLLATLAAAPAEGAIAMSRGQQFLPISQQECLARARAALQAAGYTLWGDTSNGPWGNKGDHGAIVFCEPTPDQRAVALIAVATANATSGDVPGAERERLQQLMERTATAPVAECPGNAAGLRGTGNVLTCWCTPAATQGGSVWGSKVYTDDSAICRAALHAGVISGAGGTVTIRSLAGMSSYAPSTSNGVTSSDYGVWPGSYRFE
jgi:hypothetical protein